MKKHAEKLDSLSGYLFLVGFISSKLKNIPIFIVTAILTPVSLGAYLIGYIAWYMASLFYPDHPRKNDSWYAFAKFRQQYQFAALLGTMATIMCVVSPPLLIPTAWLYTGSNLMWSISEYHKKENPLPDDKRYSSARQSIYLRYAILVTISSILTAITATVVFFFPPTALFVLTCSSIFGTALTIASLYHWGKCAFGNYLINHSYTQLSKQLAFPLDATLKPGSENSLKPSEKKPGPAANQRGENDDEYDNLKYPSSLTCH